MNKKEICSLIDRRFAGEFEGPIGFDEYIELIVECFDNESEVEEFIKTQEFDYVCALSEAYEEIMEKFPNDSLEELFEKYVLPTYPDGKPTPPCRYETSTE